MVGPYAASGVLLAVAGAPKVARPDSTARVIATVIRPVPLLWVRAFGAGELVVGILTLLTSSRVVASLVALSYAAFAGFIALALRRSDLESCGCFAHEAPPGVPHLVMNVLFTAVAVSVAATRAPTWLGVVRDTPGRGLTLALIVAVLSWLSYLLLTRPPVGGVSAAATVGSAP
jgi:uncharacterized membrane protein YphA (DoxX/SURF4 family)